MKSDLSTLGMSLSIPYNHDPNYMARVGRFLPWVHDIYLAPPPDVANTLKPFHEDGSDYRKTIEELSEECRVHGIVLSWVLNAPRLESHMSGILKFLEERLIQKNQVSVTVADLEVAERIHESLPEVKIASSLASFIKNERQAEEWIERTGAAIIHPDKSLIRHPEVLAQIRALGVKVKLIINNRCVINSPYCEEHRSCSMLGFGRAQADESISSACGKIADSQPWRMAPLTLPPAVLPRLKGVLDIVKLDGRNWPTSQIVQDIQSTIMLSSWSMFPWFVEPEDAFDHLNTCDWDCDSCGWCPSSFWFYQEEAKHGPRILRQFQALDPNCDHTTPSPAGTLGWLLRSSLEHGLRPLAIIPKDDDTGMDLDFHWRDGGVFRCRLIRINKVQKQGNKFFASSNHLGVNYLFESSEAPAGLLQSIESLVADIKSFETQHSEYSGEAPMLLDQMDIGGFCVQDCLFCDKGSKQQTGHEPGPDSKLIHPPQTDAFVNLLSTQKRYRTMDRRRRLEFIGQDPGRRADLGTLIRAAKDAGYDEISVAGPATALGHPGWAERLADSGLTSFQVALHGPTAKLHEALTQRAGSFEETMAGIESLRDCGVDLELGCVCTRSSLSTLAKTISIVRPTGVHLYNLLSKQRLSPDELITFDEVHSHISNALQTIGNTDLINEQVAVHLYGFGRCQAQALDKIWPGKVLTRDTLAISEVDELGLDERCENCEQKKWCTGIPKWQLELEPYLPVRAHPSHPTRDYAGEDLRKLCDFRMNKAWGRITCASDLQAFVSTVDGMFILPYTMGCNQACSYCAVRGDFELPADKTIDEIEALAQRAFDEGFKKVFLVGGEPTSRQGLDESIGKLKKIGFEHVALASNGIELASKRVLDGLVRAGLDSVSLSLDSTDPKVQSLVTSNRSNPMLVSKALANLAANSEVSLSIFSVLCKPTAPSLVQLVETIDSARQKYAKEITLGISGLKLAGSALGATELHMSYLSMRPYLDSATSKAQELKLPWIALHLPPCIFELPINRIWELLIMEGCYNTDMKTIFTDPDYLATFTKIGICRDCPLNMQCPGVSRRYLEQFGTDEFLVPWTGPSIPL